MAGAVLVAYLSKPRARRRLPRLNTRCCPSLGAVGPNAGVASSGGLLRRSARLGAVFSAHHRGDGAGAFTAGLDRAAQRNAVRSAIVVTRLHRRPGLAMITRVPRFYSVRNVFEGKSIQFIFAFAIYLGAFNIFFRSPNYISSISDVWGNIAGPHRLYMGPGVVALLPAPPSKSVLPHVVFAPAGYNLAWATGIPGPSLLAYPITRWFGPVVAYNVLWLLAPASAAGAAFLLCRHITGRFWPALLGGYVFGFFELRNRRNGQPSLILF